MLNRSIQDMISINTVCNLHQGRREELGDSAGFTSTGNSLEERTWHREDPDSTSFFRPCPHETKMSFQPHTKTTTKLICRNPEPINYSIQFRELGTLRTVSGLVGSSMPVSLIQLQEYRDSQYWSIRSIAIVIDQDQIFSG